jgi:cell division transport system ATP-binding protein
VWTYGRIRIILVRTLIPPPVYTLRAGMIELAHVSLSYELPGGRRRTVLEDVSLTIQQGEMVYLVGPTGSGKTTLLRLVYMDVLPDKGVARIGDYRTDAIRPRDIPYLRRSLGVVFQDFQLLPDRNVFENVAFALYVTGKAGSAVKNRVMQVLTRVGLSHKHRRYPHELSGGEQQRVAIARALANEPWILLADEPTGNLDPHVADDILKLIVSLYRQGMTVLMATHDYRLVKEFPARTLAVSNGHIAEAKPEAL